MNDKMIKFLLLLIAIGLFLNAGAMFYNSLVTPAYAADSRVYLDGGSIKVTMERPVELRLDRAIPIRLDDEVRVDTFGASNVIKVKVDDVVQVRQTN